MRLAHVVSRHVRDTPMLRNCVLVWEGEERKRGMGMNALNGWVVVEVVGCIDNAKRNQTANIIGRIVVTHCHVKLCHAN